MPKSKHRGKLGGKAVKHPGRGNLPNWWPLLLAAVSALIMCGSPVQAAYCPPVVKVPCRDMGDGRTLIVFAPSEGGGTNNYWTTADRGGGEAAAGQASSGGSSVTD